MSVSKEPNISIVTILNNSSDFLPLVQYHWDTLKYPKDKLEWILIDDSKESHQHLLPLHENILYIQLDSDFYLKDIHFKNDDKIYTKGGDRGQTSLGDGRRVSKNVYRIKAYGEVDEANSAIGIAFIHSSDELRLILRKIQHHLFDIGADLCKPYKEENSKRFEKI